jgi:hypothetical protein
VCLVYELFSSLNCTFFYQTVESRCDNFQSISTFASRQGAIDRSWLTGETVARFALVLGGLGEVALDPGRHILRAARAR